MNPFKKWREEKRKLREERHELLKSLMYAYHEVSRIYWKIVDRHYDDGDLPDELMDKAGRLQMSLIELDKKISHIWAMES